ncbi:MAG: LysE family transporter [Acidimicrobiales bacterium]
MSAPQSLLTLWLIYIGVALSPGVNFALIGQTATRYSRRAALFVAAGVVTASAMWMAAALVGLVALAERAGSVFGVIRVVAGLYLVVLGIQKIRHRNTAPEVHASPRNSPASWQHYLVGFVTSMGNPKAILFFGTLFATAFPSDATTALRLSGALVVLVSSVAIHAGLASVLSIDSVRDGYLRARRLVDPIFGLVFIGFGVRLVRTDP